MTRRCVTDEQYGLFCRKLGEVVRRVDEGTLPLEPTLTALQAVVEGEFLKVYGSFVVNIDYNCLIVSGMLYCGGRVAPIECFDTLVVRFVPAYKEGKRTVNMSVICFGEKVETRQAITTMKRQGFRPARLEELLALVEVHPDLANLAQRLPLIALSNIVGAGVPFLDKETHGLFHLRCRKEDWLGGWTDICWFAVVRE